MLAVANERDKQRIAALQEAALQAGKNRTETYVGDDGRRRTIAARVQDVSAKTETGAIKCRRLHTDITVEGSGSTTVAPQYTCQGPDGSWNMRPPAGAIMAA